jgi:hypothetical protein
MITGKYLVAKLNGVLIENVFKWNAEEGGDVLDATVGTDLGFEYEEMGVENCHVTTTLYLDIVNGVYSNVQRGTVLTNLQLFRNVADTVPALLIPFALVVRSGQGAEVRGKFEVPCEIHSQGPYTTNDPQG